MIKESILGAGVFLEPDVIIERGCLIGEGVVIPSHTRIKEFSRISKDTLADSGMYFSGINLPSKTDVSDSSLS